MAGMSRSIAQFLAHRFFLLILVLILFLGLVWTIQLVWHFGQHTADVEDAYQKQTRRMLKEQVDHVVGFISLRRRALVDRVAAEEREAAEQKCQEEMAEWIDDIHFGKDGYVFAGDWNGVSKSGPAKGQNMLKVVDRNGEPIVQELIDLSRKSDGGWLTYVMPPVDGKRSATKMSYVRGVPEWGWYVGAGIYVDDMADGVQQEKARWRSGLLQIVLVVVGILLLALAGSTWVSRKIAHRFGQDFQVFNRFFKDAADTTASLNLDVLRLQELRLSAELANQMIQRRKEAEHELRESEERFRLLVEGAPDAFFLHDIGGSILQVNAAACRALGYTREELLRLNILDIDTSFSRAKAEVLWKGMKTGAGVTFEGQHRRKDGTTFPVEVCATSLNLSGNRVIFGFVRDVSERHKAEAEKSKLEDQLRQAQKMEAVGQLAGGIAHDFNNLLQVINGRAELLETSLPSDAPWRDDVQHIAQAGERAARLVSQLLAFSRRQIMRLGDLDLNEVVSGLLKMVNRVIGEDIRLDFVPGHQLGMIRADRGMIEQILMNLCVNSRDAMPKGGSLTIETENVLLTAEYCRSHPWALPGRFVLLRVTDNGEGMDKETLSRIFEPFFTTKEQGKGTGLGLAMVYGLVKQHDGMINCHSEVGKGTTFRIYLPVSERPAETVGCKINGPTPGGNETILLAEDDEHVRELAKTLLELAGYRVLTACDGTEAVALFTQHAKDVQLLLLDVVMPKMGGRDAYEQISHLRAGIPVLFSSGYSENAVHTNFVLDQGLQLLQKPFARDDLLRCVRRALDGETGK